MNCRDYQAKIDELAASAEIALHVEKCASCRLFQSERERLILLICKLERAAAPANFEFGLRARLNAAPTTNNNARIWRRRFVFASPALAAAAVSIFVLTNNTNFAPPTGQQPQAIVETRSINAPLPPVTSEPTTTSNSEIAKAPDESTIVQPLPTPLKAVARKNIGSDTLRANSSAKIRRVENKSRQERVLARDIYEPRHVQDISLKPIDKPLLPAGTDQQKIAATQVLSFFGLNVSNDEGRVESVKADSEAAQKGIAAGDVIETVNGQKIVGANLENLLKQVELDVVRGSERRKVVLTLKTELPK